MRDCFTGRLKSSFISNKLDSCWDQLRKNAKIRTHYNGITIIPGSPSYQAQSSPTTTPGWQFCQEISANGSNFTPLRLDLIGLRHNAVTWLTENRVKLLLDKKRLLADSCRVLRAIVGFARDEEAYQPLASLACLQNPEKMFFYGTASSKPVEWLGSYGLLISC